MSLRSKRQQRHGRRSGRTLGFEPLEGRAMMAAVAISSPPVLNSLPGATNAIYLDFNGDGKYGPFSRDGNTATFSDAEQNDIKEIWSIVAEKFSPFNINVTTVPPKGNQTHAVISKDYDGVGVAYVGSFPRTAAAAWINGTMSNAAIGLTAAHEAGHTFGLAHQSAYDSKGNLIDEYRNGNGSISPIMGGGSLSTRTVWAKGTSSYGPTKIQDDLAKVAGTHNGVTIGYRADDHGSTIKSADKFNGSGNKVTQSGIIEKTSDKDVFVFNTGAGTVEFTASVAKYGAMLNLTLQLLDAQGKVLKTVDTSSLGESLSLKVPKGKYFLVVLSKGKYGDVGQYTLKGTIIGA